MNLFTSILTNLTALILIEKTAFRLRLPRTYALEVSKLELYELV